MGLLQQHRERQKNLLPLFSPELRAMRMAFLKGLWQMFLVFTCVFWISISFLYGAGYDTARHMKDARFIFRNFDSSPAATNISQMIIKAFEPEGMVTLVDHTNDRTFDSIEAIKHAVWVGDSWGAIVVNEGFGDRLSKALTEGADYEPTQAVTLISEESRHFFKVMIATKSIQAALTALEVPFSQMVFQDQVAQGNTPASIIGRANPQALVLPYSYAVDNIAPYHFDMSMYILSVTLSLCMVVGSFIPSNMWKTIEEPFFKQVKIPQIIALRLVVNIVWAIFICIQATGIVFAFSGPTWSPNAGDFFGLFGLFLLNTFAFTFFIDCLQNWVHPRFLLGAYFTTLFVDIAAAIFGPELNNHFFRITYAMPFLLTGISMRTLLTNGSYAKFNYTITVVVLWAVFWWVVSVFLISRKARLVRAGKLLMSNVPPPLGTDSHQHEINKEKSPAVDSSSEPDTRAQSQTPVSSETTPGSSSSNSMSSAAPGSASRRHEVSGSDIEIEDM
ncbi:hypothetical protein J3B02_002555 [Coemansia erecta]|uniref:DUF3533 domain-containing protein n=1 Tax=Coemansia asiatica TaxID=1052880 RepID=A0A9W7XGJ9_9FUNG|nr:hypothetical protein LPJ64_004211 [Coemansia asiatica]KAJ2854681.1 hypothetical protein J3B02_002555 [Coemansia erecta]KAJ2884373.1 hypothetical protein FB639_001972 [Coemansia asiatica]